MKCPMCNQEVTPQQTECSCRELLTTWRNRLTQGRALRQKGLRLARKGDYLGALVAFLQDALTNTMERGSVVDAAKALFYLNRPREALQLLELADGTAGQAAQVANAMKVIWNQAAKNQAEEAEQSEVTEPSPSSDEEEKTTTRKPAAVETFQEAAAESTTADKPPNPLMGFGLLPGPTKKGIKIWSKDKNLEAWNVILAMEKMNACDWRGLHPFLEKKVEEANEPEIYYYVLGLDHWQAGHNGRASSAFNKCLQRKPPVLNPAFYYLYLELESDIRATHAWKFLADWLPKDEQKRFHKRLEQKLKDWSQHDRLERLCRLQIV